MEVDLVGDGPAAEAVRAALSDIEVETTNVAVESFKSDLTIVIGRVNDETLETANEMALKEDKRWIAVELGGIGGYPVVDASIAGFGPNTGCYECLQSRVESNLDDDSVSTQKLESHTERYAGAIAGRAVAQTLVTDESTVYGLAIEVPHAERSIVPVPDCVCAPEPRQQLSLQSVDRSLEESLALAERGLDARIGIVNEVGEFESVPAPYYLAQGCDTSNFSDATAARNAAGVAPDWDEAFMKALGEGLERYSSGIYRIDSLVKGPPSAVDGAVWPGNFVCQSEPTNEESIQWVDGQNLHSRTDVKLPAEFVHYPPAAERFRPSITTGLGLGNGGCEAVLSGLYEVVERDAAMLSWYSTFEPLELEIEDDSFDDLTARAGMADLTVTSLLLTQDIDIPVVAVAVHRDTWPRLALGSAANLNPDLAARSGLAEALQNWMELRQMGRGNVKGASGKIGQYADFPEAIRSYIMHETTVPSKSVGPSEVPTGRSELAAVLERIEAANLTAYAASTTTRDLRDIGFQAVRALVPKAQPLFFDKSYFGDRARSVPDEMGYSPTLDHDHHPFP